MLYPVDGMLTSRTRLARVLYASSYKESMNSCMTSVFYDSIVVALFAVPFMEF